MEKKFDTHFADSYRCSSSRVLIGMN